MWQAEHTLDTLTEPGQVWGRVADVATWPEWDAGLAWAKLAGPFAAGTEGTLKFHHEGPRPFRIVQVEPDRSFTATTRLLFADLRHSHRQEASAMGTRFTQRIEIVGPLAWLHGWTRGRRLREGLAPCMRMLARVALESK